MRSRIGHAKLSSLSGNTTLFFITSILKAANPVVALFNSRRKVYFRLKNALVMSNSKLLQRILNLVV